MGNTRRRRGSAPCWLAALAAMLPHAGAWALDLAAARSWRLDNGMTVIVLEEHALPVVSVQMLYAVGARNEDNGRTGAQYLAEAVRVFFQNLTYYLSLP